MLSEMLEDWPLEDLLLVVDGSNIMVYSVQLDALTSVMAEDIVLLRERGIKEVEGIPE